MFAVLLPRALRSAPSRPPLAQRCRARVVRVAALSAGPGGQGRGRRGGGGGPRRGARDDANANANANANAADDADDAPASPSSLIDALDKAAPPNRPGDYWRGGGGSRSPSRGSRGGRGRGGGRGDRGAPAHSRGGSHSRASSSSSSSSSSKSGGRFARGGGGRGGHRGASSSSEPVDLTPPSDGGEPWPSTFAPPDPDPTRWPPGTSKQVMIDAKRAGFDGPPSAQGARRLRKCTWNNRVLIQLEEKDQLLDFIAAEVHTFHTMNFSTAMHRLGKMNKRLGWEVGLYGVRGKGVEGGWRLTDDPRFVAFERALGEYAALHARALDDPSALPPWERHGSFRAREIASLMWGLANTGRTLKELKQNPNAPGLYDFIFDRVASLPAQSFAPQNVSNAVWAIAKMHADGDEWLPFKAIRALESHAAEKMDEFIPQGVSNCAWALGSLNKLSVSVSEGFRLEARSVDAFSRGVVKNADAFKSMELSNVVWAIGTLQDERFSEEALDALDGGIAREIRDNPHTFSTQSVANILWGCGVFPQGARLKKSTLDALADLTYRNFDKFTHQGLTNTCWGFAAVGYNPGAPFFDKFREVFRAEGHAFNVTELSNMLWSFYTLKEHPGERELRIAGDRLLALPEEDLMVSTVGNLMYSLAQYEHLPRREVMARLERVTAHLLSDPSGRRDPPPHTLANYVWALSALKYKPGGAFVKSLSAAVIRAGPHFNDQSVSNVLNAYAVLDADVTPELAATFDRACLEQMKNFAPQGVGNTFWAWAVLGARRGGGGGGGGEEDGSEEDRDAYRRRFLSSKSFPKSFPRSPEVAREVRGDDGTPGADSDSGPSATHLAPRWPSPELAAAYAKRLRALRVEECSRVDMIQMFQASKAFEAYAPPHLASLGPFLEGEFAERSRECWERTTRGRITISALHRDVSETLTRMGIPHEIEASATDGGLAQSVDVALRGRKVAIEVDGPSHFYANRRGERTGGDRLREAILESHGWKVRDTRGARPAFFFFFFSFPRKTPLTEEPAGVGRRGDDGKASHRSLSAPSLTANAREALKLQNI